MIETFTGDGISIALVDDDEAVLDSLQMYLKRRGVQAFAFVSAESLLEALDSGAEFQCIVSDVRMPGMSGVELQSELSDRGCPWPLILITGHGDVDMAVSALKAGAFDFIEKPADEERLLASIREAVTSSREKAEAEAELAELSRRYSELSERQREVMGMVAQGLANKEIAARLGISSRTVEHYREWAMERMKANTLAELVHMAVRLGLTGRKPLRDA
jgi:two-component system response regulator FixJ